MVITARAHCYAFDKKFMYFVFQYMMQYLYHGGVRSLDIAGEDVLELMGAAHFFMLDGLQRHCEVLCSQTLTPATCTSIYKHAKVR